MFQDPKNRQKIISFFIALSLVIITTFFVNEDEKEMERISGKIGVIEKETQADLSIYLLAKSEFSQAMMYVTLGSLHMESGYRFHSLYLPVKDAVIRGVSSLNVTLHDNDENRLDDEQLQTINEAFDRSIAEDDFNSFFAVFMNTQVVIQKLNLAYQDKLQKLATQKLKLKNMESEISVHANLLTWLAAIIGFVQLFFTSFYDMYNGRKTKTNNT